MKIGLVGWSAQEAVEKENRRVMFEGDDGSGEKEDERTGGGLESSERDESL